MARPELSPADVERLLADPSPANRAATAGKIARGLDPGALGPRERGLALEILSVMARDAEVRVRRALSENLKDNPSVPRELALRLARDVAEVAVPILAQSPVFADDDLIKLVIEGSADHQSAIAGRRSVSAALADTIAEHAAESAVSVLVGNEGAAVSDGAMGKVLDRFPQSESVHNAMTHRSHLPLVVAERLVSMVSDSLRDYLVTHHEMSPDTAADVLLESRERAFLGLVAEADLGGSAAILAQELQRNGRLVPSLVLRALYTGDMPFFAAALAAMAHIPVSNADRLVHDPGGRGLEALYRRCGLPLDQYAVARAAVEVAAEMQYDGGPADRARFVERMIERLLTRADTSLPGNESEWLIARLERARAEVAAQSRLH